MNKDWIKKMLNAKYIYVVEYFMKEVNQLYSNMPKREVFKIVVYRYVKYRSIRKHDRYLNEVFFTKKEVDNFINKLKNMNKYIKPSISTII